jgi:putative membrane-bound dehydrogenase-like protein
LIPTQYSLNRAAADFVIAHGLITVHVALIIYRKPMTRLLHALLLLAAFASGGFPAEKEQSYQIGVAKTDITPDYPIRLSGYAVRKKESEGVAQRLFAKALAIGSDKEGAAILITVDNCGVPKHVRDEVVARLAKRKIDPSRIAICSSHSHTTPYLAGYLPTLFGEPLPPEHQAHVERYTRELTDKIEAVALQALKDRKPGKLAWGQTKAGFAANRRTKGGPVDHDLPVLVATDRKGNLRALLANYACHCTTLGGETNQICGDWAGYAQEYLERDHPGAIVLVAIGCGADANPEPRTGIDLAKRHGQEIAQSVNELLGQVGRVSPLRAESELAKGGAHGVTRLTLNKLTPIRGPLNCRAKEIQLPLDTLPTRAELERQTTNSNSYIAYHARWNLARLDRDGALPATVPYLVQTWRFDNSMAMVFLPGEVVVDYSLRLKKEFDPQRLWVNAYANDVPCYIPSERILKEGGYEGGGAMTYYGWPTRIAPGVEDLIINTVHELLPKEFLFDEKKAELPPPLSPEESLATIQTKPGFEVQLVACDPLVVDPVAIDWGADGELWVVEMRDYPMGMDGKWKPGSRVKVLEDTNGDGRYDKATVVIDNIPFSTGVTAWRDGALVCTAPDILYVENNVAQASRLPARKDSQAISQSADGTPALPSKIFSGFATDNYQARVNSLSLGLDNWIYGANGLLGGAIRGLAGANEVNIRGRDFRMHPDTGEFEPASGLTQQGRARDDWGNWFGCDNSVLTWHFPIHDHYIRRNPYVAAPSPRVSIASGNDPGRVFPISRTLERFNDPAHANRITSICGLGIYRDNLLGDEYNQNIFVCEPVHNLVRRVVPKPNGLTFAGVRAPDEQHCEFLASRDNWFRPAQVRTGPDGALYVVDMYRFVIEHPRWISAERLAKLDVRAGADKGRIYRVVPTGRKLRPIQNLRKLSPAKLVAAFDTPNGTMRDLVHLELTQRGADKAAIRFLEELARKSKTPAVRLQAACALDALNALTPEMVEGALQDEHPAVRANAVRLSEPFLRNRSATAGASHTALQLTEDPDLTVRYQLALSLGERDDARAGEALGKLAARDIRDPWVRAAILSSAMRQPADILKSVVALDSKMAGRSEMIAGLVATTAGAGNSDLLGKAIALVVPADINKQEDWQLATVSSLLDALDRQGVSLNTLTAGSSGEARGAIQRLNALFDWARARAVEAESKESVREAAIRLLGYESQQRPGDARLLAELLEGPLAARLQSAVLDSLKRIRLPLVGNLLLQDWRRRSPALRQACVEGLLSRDEWTTQLLDAIESGVVSAAEISPVNRQRLRTHRQGEIQKRAEAFFKSVESNRAAILAKYHDATTLPGDSAKGGDIFARNCSTCHSLRGQGHNVGPTLWQLADKTAADFLLAILDPNAVVEPRFVAYNIETKDGRSLSGIVNAETATTLTLVQSGGIQEKILRSDIAEIRASGLSLMPDGLEQNMSSQDLADLIAYLKTSPRAFGSATREQAEEAKKRLLTAGMNGFARLISSFDQLPYPSWMGELPMPYCRQTDGSSKLTWQTASMPGDLKPDAIQEFRLPVAMGFVSQPRGKFELWLNGKRRLEFNVALNDQTWQSADGKVQMSYTVMESNNEDSNGVLLIRVAGALLKPDEPATFEVVGSAANSQRWFGIYLVSPTVARTSRP